MMMNKTIKECLIGVVLCLHALGMAQAEYVLSVHGNAHHSSNAHCAEVGFDVILSNGERRKVHTQSYGTAPFRVDFDKAIPVPDNVTIREIKVWASRRIKSSCNGDRPNHEHTFTVAFPYNCFESLAIQHGNSILANALWNTNFNVELRPKPEVLPPANSIDNFLPLDNPITIQATKGFPEILSNYTWSYKVVGENAKLLPTVYQGKQQINITARDLFGSQAENYLGREVRFSILSCGQTIVSNPSTAYQIIPSAPEIVSAVPILPDCYDSNGGVRFTFSRPLFPNELLSIVPAVGFPNFPNGDSQNLSQLQPHPTTGALNSYTIMGITPDNNYRATVNGFYTPADVNTYSDAPGHYRPFSIGRPTLVEFSVEKLNDDYCNDGDDNATNNNDGRVRITARGGSPGTYEYLWRDTTTGTGTWQSFSSGATHTLTGLAEGNYDVQVRKRVGSSYCVARIQTPTASGIALGAPIVTPVIIESPDAPLAVTYTLINAPTAFGFEDARLQAVITGGTPLANGSYAFEWRDQNNIVVSTTITEVLSGNQGYRVLLHSVGDGNYSLTVRDANFTTAFNTVGCAVLNSEYPIQEPPQLTITLAITNEISCSNQNAYSDQIDTNFDSTPDQFQDGEITATVSGGVPFDVTNPGAIGTFPRDRNGTPLPYRYEWKIQDATNTWIPIDEPTNRISILSTATYALNIIDSNGITVGAYETFIEADGSQSYRLVTAIDETQFLPQPDSLIVSFTTTMPSCSGGDDATATVQVTGGIPPYQYRWSQGGTTPNIVDLIGGKYVVFVTDAKGCQVEGTLTIDQPGGIEITVLQEKAPTCIGDTDGALAVQITGGTPPYAYQWVIGSTSTNTAITGLAQGTYRLRVTDANDCTAFYEKILEDPAPILIDLGPDRALCLDQSLTLDGSILNTGATYQWSSDTGFSSASPTVTLTASGTYTVTATTPEGCTGSDTIVVTVFDTPIDAEYLLSSQAYPNTEVVLVNISWPLGERTEWILPDEVKILEETPEYLHVSFPEARSYDIGIRSRQGDCIAEFYDKIIVLPDPNLIEVTTAGPFIQDFIMTPNPSNGNFSTQVQLAQEANISLQCINLQSAKVVDSKEGKGQDSYQIQHTINVPSGVYLMILETPGGTQVKKLVIE